MDRDDAADARARAVYDAAIRLVLAVDERGVDPCGVEAFAIADDAGLDAGEVVGAAAEILLARGGP